ncbi:MAG: putative toxin-antitoxin system toxin component, PIN family [Desulfobacteraceae bacterium IS3]|nr:MAG: putative toxin-antitoxin system toxin component, PIN family [Desulfobacteraceae bacterium IS3]
MSKFRIVLDTNILLVSISSRSKYHWIFLKLLNGAFDLYVTNEILTEYEEIIASKYNEAVAGNVLRALLKLPNVHRQTVYYRWNMIGADPDDNKFADCAVSANAHYLISNDRHFSVLDKTEFPGIEVLTIDAFEAIFRK